MRLAAIVAAARRMGPLGGAAQGPEGRHAGPEHRCGVDRRRGHRTGRRHHRAGRDPGPDADRERITIARARDHSATPMDSRMARAAIRCEADRE